MYWYRYSIETCDLKGASRTVVISSELYLSDFSWLPDGRMIYARQEAPGSTEDNLWQIDIDNMGAPTGKPKRITQWAGSYLSGLSASADGKRLALLRSAYSEHVYLGELAAGGTRINPPRRLTNDEAFDMLLAWTADSKAVLFSSDRNGTPGVFKQGISQGISEPVFTGRLDISNLRLSPDGAWLVFVESPTTQANPFYRLMRMPANSGVPQLVTQWKNLVGLWCARAQGSACVIIEPRYDRKQLMITAFDPVNRRAKDVRTIEQDPSHTFGHADLSPDGSTVAISRSGEAEIHIRLLSLAGGADREIAVKGWPNITGLNWSPDGKGLYCGSVSPQGSTLLYVDLKGNAVVL